MSALSTTFERLQNTLERIADVERCLIQDPDEWGLQLSLAGLKRIEQDLRAQIQTHAETDLAATCDYRLFKDQPGSEFAITGIGESLLSFQRVISLIYEAIQLGKKDSGRISATVLEATRMRHGFAYNGSVGFCMKVSRAPALEGPDELDRAMRTFWDVIRSYDKPEFREFYRTLGKAPIAAVYEWAAAHASARLGADIVWREGSEHEVRVFVQHQQMQRIKDAIAETSPPEAETLKVTGLLVGAHTQTMRFWFIGDDGQHYQGEMNDLNEELQLPARYEASIHVTREFVFAKGIEKIAHKLLSLRRLDLV